MEATKFCIFCGQKPHHKTKEHIFPQWLIALTGNPKRVVSHPTFRSSFDGEFAQKSFSFDQLTFPACGKCNNDFAELEYSTKNIILKIIHSEAILESELSTLLDWLDKVRIGLWLGHLYLDKNTLGIVPKFHIKRRVGLSDRMLIIEKTTFQRQRLTAVGNISLAFLLSPSVFMLVINNVLLTNLSSPFLLGGRLGYPYPKKILQTESGRFLAECFHPGKCKISKPVLRKKINYASVRIYQHSYIEYLESGQFEDLYSNDYIKENTLDKVRGLGSIFVDIEGSVTKINTERGLLLEPPLLNDEIQILSSIRFVFEMQNWIIDNRPKPSFADQRETKNIETYFRAARELNRRHIREIDWNNVKFIY